MRSRTLLALAALLCSGCATTYQPVAIARLPCTGEACDLLWRDAQAWLATNGRYRIQIANDAVIQTYGPVANVFDGVAYTLTRQRLQDGSMQIVIRGSCYPGAWGACVFDPAPLTNRLYYALGGK